MSHEEAGYKSLNIVGFTVDAMQPLALFKEETGETTFPLWLEMDDILAITAELVASRFSLKAERKGLLDALLTTMSLQITGVDIDGTADNGYRAEVCLSGEETVVKVPVEIVTALLTAIKFKLQVNISAKALESSALVDQRTVDQVNSNDEQGFLEMLEKMTPEEMGKYPM